MASLAHRSKVRRAERAVILRHGNINLVPLVDILTSIVFFSLLTYTGEQLMNLTAYDLSLPPQMVQAPSTNTRGRDAEELNLLLAVRIEPNKLIVEHSDQNGFKREIAGIRGASLEQLRGLMTQIKQQYPQNSDVLIVPDDAVAYDDVVHVMEQLRLSNYTGLSLGSRSRAQTVTSGGEVTR